MMKLNAARRLPFEVPPLCFGTSPLGSMPDTYGYEVSEERAHETLRALCATPPWFIDTSRNYGMGRSEERVGRVLAELGGLPDGCVMATKVDRDMDTNRLDADRARRSVEESLVALGVERLQILHLHDPEYCRDLSEITGPGGALDEIFKMKQEGLVDAVGLAMGKLPLMTSIMADWNFDALVSHNRFTLLNREADAMFTMAHGKGIAIFNAAPYCGGILAKGTSSTSRVTYQDATEAQIRGIRAIESVCKRYDLPLGAVALQFSMRDHRVTSTICGVSKPERVSESHAWAQWHIPTEAWDEIMALPFQTSDPEANRVYLAC